MFDVRIYLCESGKLSISGGGAGGAGAKMEARFGFGGKRGSGKQKASSASKRSGVVKQRGQLAAAGWQRVTRVTRVVATQVIYDNSNQYYSIL